MSHPPVVLVVDDDEDLRESLCELLQEDGYEAVSADTGATALRRLRSDDRRPDVILLDLMMPVMNGWQFREAQLLEPALASIPVIVMTARRDVQGITADEVIYKPPNLDRLLEVIRRLSGRDRGVSDTLRDRALNAETRRTTNDTLRETKEHSRLLADNKLQLSWTSDVLPGDRPGDTASARDESRRPDASALLPRAAERAATIPAGDEIREQRGHGYSLFAQAPVPICVFRGHHLVYEMANDLYLQVVGRNDILGKPLLQALPEFKGQGFDDLLRNVMKTGKAFVGKEMRQALARGRDGAIDETYWTFTYAPLAGPEGAVDRVMCFSHEVTDQVVARQQAEREEQKFRGLVTQVQAGIAQTDLMGRFVLANARYREIVGRSEAELRQLCMQDITHPDDLPRHLEAFGKLVDEGIPFVIEKRYVKPDGSIVWVQNSVSRIDGREGRPQAVAAVTVDITRRKYAEDALRESEERFRNMADKAPVMVWVTAPDASCTYLSKSWYELTGQTPETALGFGWLSAVHPEDAESSSRIFIAANKTREPFRLEYRLRRKDGQYRWAIDSAIPRIGRDGEFLGYIGSVIDITDRKTSELALETSQARVQSLFVKEQAARKEVDSVHRIANSLVDAGLDLETLVQRLTDQATELVEAKFGAFFYNVVDEAGESYLLYTLSGAPIEAFAKFGLPRNTPLFERTFSGKGAVRFDDVKADPAYGRMAPHHGMPKGHLPVTSYLAVPVVSRTGEVFGGLFFGHPEAARFTEQHERMVTAIAAQAAVEMENVRLYQAARTSEARFRSIFETAEVSIWEEDFSAVKPLIDTLKAQHGEGLRQFLEDNPSVVQDAVGYVRLLDVNTATLRMFGASHKDELLGTLSTIFVPETHTVFLEELMALAEGRRLFTAEAPLRTLTGERVDVLLTMNFPPELERVLVTLVDISSRKVAEVEREARIAEMERAVRFSEMFVGILGHDLRNPLSSITTAANLLEMRADSEKIAKPVGRIVLSADRMERMISQLLDFTRIRLGRGLPLDRASVDLTELARTMIEELEPVHKRDIRLDVSGDVVGAWDRDRLHQLLDNLTRNACQHGTPGTPVLVELDGSNMDVMRLAVRNQGTISPDLLPVLFEPLATNERRKKRERSGGLGLGLYISQQIAIAHGGTITVASHDEEGTSFTVEISRHAVRSAEGVFGSSGASH